MKALALMTSPLDKLTHALWAMESFQEQVPELEVTWVVRDVFAPLVDACACVERAIVVPRRFGLGEGWELTRRIRAERYDVVLDFEGHARTGALAGLARARRKIGRRAALEGATIFYSELAPAPSSGASHLLDHYLELGRVFGLMPRRAEALRLRSLERAPEAWEGAWRGQRLCLFPGRFRAERAWPRMFELAADLLERRHDLTVFCLGLNAVGAPAELAKRFGNRFVDLQTRTSWEQSLSMLEEADAVVANDNGPAQLAGALGRPNLGLYGYVSVEERGAYPLDERRNAFLLAPHGQIAGISLQSVVAETEKLLALARDGESAASEGLA